MRAILMVLALLASTVVGAESFPGSKPIALVVAFSAGGPVDRLARDLAEALRGPLGGARIVVENVAGAGGTIAAARVARARPDGHTLLLHHIGMATIPALYRKPPFDVLADFDYLGLVTEVPMTLIGRPDLAAQDFQALRAWIRSYRGRISLGHAGPGAASHLCGLMLQSALRTEMMTVRYKGTAPAMADLISGRIDLLCDQTTNTAPQIERARVRAYAVTTAARLDTPALQRLPTLNELGLQGFDLTVWNGLYAPRGTPPAVVAQLNEALRQALKDTEFVTRQQALGAVVIQDERVHPTAHRRFVQAEIEKLGAAIRAVEAAAD